MPYKVLKQIFLQCNVHYHYCSKTYRAHSPHVQTKPFPRTLPFCTMVFHIFNAFLPFYLKVPSRLSSQSQHIFILFFIYCLLTCDLYPFVNPPWSSRPKSNSALSTAEPFTCILQLFIRILLRAPWVPRKLNTQLYWLTQGEIFTWDNILRKGMNEKCDFDPATHTGTQGEDICGGFPSNNLPFTEHPLEL